MQRRPDLNIDETVEAFREWWQARPGKDGLKLDWGLTFKAWVRTTKPPPGTPPPPVLPSRGGNADRLLAHKLLSAAAIRHKAETWVRPASQFVLADGQPGYLHHQPSDSLYFMGTLEPTQAAPTDYGPAQAALAVVNGEGV